MIRITQQDSASGAKRYYATSDYYSEGQELVGCWGGKGAARLGLEGTVDKSSFERLCDNLHPATGEPLTVRTRSDRTVGYDFTFSVPKSVSLLYAMTGDAEILAAFRGAVDETMREIETEMKTRVRKGRKDEDRVTGDMVWAEFIHTTSRPVEGVPDPQLHAHCFVFNTTSDQHEERWKAGQFRELKRDAPYFQAAFRVRLANRLQDLGFGIERKRDDFEVAGIPRDILRRFSRRTAVIEKTAEELGITDPDRKAELGAETREKKGKSLSLDELREKWASRMTVAERHQLEGTYCRATPYARPERGEKEAVDHAVGHSFVREAVVPERKIVTEALKRGIGAVTVEGVTREVGQRPLIRSDIAGRGMATTKEMLALESRLIDFAREERGRCRPLGDPQRPCSRDWFNEGQKAAVRHVLGSRDRVMIIRGVAGTGKTTLEQEIGEALAETGKPVVAVAQSTKARDVLRTQAGMATADTVAMFLKSEPMQQSAKGGVILVDEASLIGTRDMGRLFEIAESVNARVVLVGDRRQHRSVTAGEPLKLLEGRAGLRVAEVTEILRQQGDYKEAAKALSEGRVADAFAELDKLGWIREVPDAERNQQLADAYLAAVAERKKNGEHKSALVVSPTHAEARGITEAIRAAMQAQGKLTKERVVTTWVPTHLTGCFYALPHDGIDDGVLHFESDCQLAGLRPHVNVASLRITRYGALLVGGEGFLGRYAALGSVVPPQSAVDQSLLHSAEGGKRKQGEEPLLERIGFLDGHFQRETFPVLMVQPDAAFVDFLQSVGGGFVGVEQLDHADQMTLVAAFCVVAQRASNVKSAPFRVMKFGNGAQNGFHVRFEHRGSSESAWVGRVDESVELIQLHADELKHDGAVALGDGGGGVAVRALPDRQA
jgi:conjugative relaxase-like TrwC/TraI family protein